MARHAALRARHASPRAACQLSSSAAAQIVTCSWDGVSGTLTSIHSVSVLPDHLEPCRAHHSGASHIIVSRSGKHVYATSRTDGTAIMLQALDTCPLLEGCAEDP